MINVKKTSLFLFFLCIFSISALTSLAMVDAKEDCGRREYEFGYVEKAHQKFPYDQDGGHQKKGGLPMHLSAHLSVWRIFPLP